MKPETKKWKEERLYNMAWGLLYSDSGKVPTEEEVQAMKEQLSHDESPYWDALARWWHEC
jgi:hypothetical protein